MRRNFTIGGDDSARPVGTARRAGWVAAAAVLGLGAGWAGAGEAAHDRIAFRPATPPAGQTAYAGPGAVRSRPISVNLAALQEVDLGEANGVRLNLFDGVAPLAIPERFERRDDAGYTCSGRLGGGFAGCFVLSVVDDAVGGAVWIEGGATYEVRSDEHGGLWAIELDPNAFHECAAHERPALGPGRPLLAEALPTELGDAPRGACDDDGSVIDVLVVYTPQALQSSGGLISITAQNAIASANTAYANSQISTSLRMAGMYMTSYNESGSIGTDLTRLADIDDGYMDDVHVVRDYYNADVVVLLAHTPSEPGAAYVMTSLSPAFASGAFAVVDVGAAVGNLTFAHEVGHIMGCGHDPDNGGPGLFSDSHGHRFTALNFNQYRTIMAYSPGSRIPYFSHPGVLYIGAPTGVVNQRFNARAINAAAETVANFRNGSGLSAPAFPGVIAPYTASPGETVSFGATAAGSGPITYAWSRNGTPLNNSGRISGVNTPNLTILDARPADSGVYTLSAVNACGSDLLSVTLDVSSGPCPADVAAPYGVLNFFDVATFLNMFSGGHPAADLAAPAGRFDFFDVSAFLTQFNTGCP